MLFDDFLFSYDGRVDINDLMASIHVPEKKEYYSIGEVSKYCQLTPRALRYYGDAGLLMPDMIKDNGYRFYTYHTMLRIPIIKYLKTMGFSLEQIQHVMAQDDFEDILETFNKRLDSCLIEMRDLSERHHVIEDWKKVITEAKQVIKSGSVGVNLKHLPETHLFAMSYEFRGDYIETAINIDFNNFVEESDNRATGAVMIHCRDARHMREVASDEKPYPVLMVQEVLRPIPENRLFVMPAGLYASCYHVGPYENLNDSYQKIDEWAIEHGVELCPDSIERLVSDYWTTQLKEQYVTEIIVPFKETGCFGIYGKDCSYENI